MCCLKSSIDGYKYCNRLRIDKCKKTQFVVRQEGKFFMSSNWQRESANNHHSENNPRRGTGGLLSTYGRLPAQQLPQSPPAQQINQPSGLGPAGPVAPK